MLPSLSKNTLRSSEGDERERERSETMNIQSLFYFSLSFLLFPHFLLTSLVLKAFCSFSSFERFRFEFRIIWYPILEFIIWQYPAVGNDVPLDGYNLRSA